MNEDEKKKLIDEDYNAEQLLRRVYGADDYLNDNKRWCIWITDSNLEKALKIPPIKQRIESVKKYREGGGEVARSLVNIPYRFRYVHEAKKLLLILPRTTSERREYLSVGFLDRDSVVTDAAQVIYDPEPYILAILSTKLHMVWVKAVGGKLKMDPRYSNSLCYNPFPFPSISETQKLELEKHVYHIMAEREEHSEKNPGAALRS